MKTSACIIGALLAAALPCGAALAQDSVTGLPSLGIRVLGTSNIYVGGQANFVALPNISFGADQFSVNYTGLRFRVYSDPVQRFELILSPSFAPYDSEDSPALAGMDRSFGVDGGFRYTYGATSNTRFTATVLTELTDEHDGQEIDMRLSHSPEDSIVPFSYFAGAIWSSPARSEYLYGVMPSEAIAGRPAYAPGETISPYIGIGTLAPITDRLSLTGVLRVQYLPDSITDSPIVDTDIAVSGALGFLWRF
jgi:outer membrane protein